MVCGYGGCGGVSVVQTPAFFGVGVVLFNLRCKFTDVTTEQRRSSLSLNPFIDGVLTP